MFRKSLMVVAMLAVACTGSEGPAGPTGPTGPPGGGGPPGTPGNPGGQTPGVTATVTVSKPTNGSFFTSGERPVLTITLTDPGTVVSPAAVTDAELFVYGPRAPTETVTNVDLMNITYAPFSASVPLQPLPDGGAPNANWKLNADGTVTYTLNPINIVTAGPIPPGQLAGTYTASVLVVGANPLDQTFALVDFQIGTATAESYASGPADGGTATPATTTCAACHGNVAPGGKMYFAHIAPGFSQFGEYELDSIPIGTCKSCHNNQGDSPNTLLRKVHGAHRGKHQLAPGVAHPEYNESADDSLAAYLNVGFPSMPLSANPSNVAIDSAGAMEKNCTACHVNNVWQTNFSRKACGTCHDNVFFAGAPLSDGGVDPAGENVVPPTNFGQPLDLNAASPTYLSNIPCTMDSQCNNQFPYGKTASPSIVTCDVTSGSATVGNCVLKNHPIPSGPDPDAVCATCHAAVTGSFAPVDAVHNITQWKPPVSLDGYSYKNVTVSGQDAGVGFFNVGDAPVLTFQFFQPDGTPVADLLTNGNWRGTFTIAGPTSNPQRLYGSPTGLASMSAPNLTYDAPSQTYTFKPGSLPPNTMAPILSGLTPQPAPPGLYTLWFYWQRTPDPTISGDEDSIDAQLVVPFQTTEALPVGNGRQVVTVAGCASCHGQSPDGFAHLALHGGPRKSAETCNTCHSQFAEDLGANSGGNSCAVNSDCGGYDSANPAKSWETCQALTCTTTVDPTPGVEIDYQKLIHNIHFARLRGGYAERNNLGAPWQNPPIPPGTLTYLGHSNTMEHFQEVLSPVDVRACANCHGDANTACQANTDCAFGQTCGAAGTCVNVAWQSPTARACMTCHDSADDAAHAALNTYTPSGGSPIESCNVCHATGAAFAVDVVHNITTLYSTHLAYPRSPP